MVRRKITPEEWMRGEEGFDPDSPSLVEQDPEHDYKPISGNVPQAPIVPEGEPEPLSKGEPWKRG